LPDLISVFVEIVPGTFFSAALVALALAAPPSRVVTLAPFITELAFDAGIGDRVVGVSAYSDYPPAARALPEVSSAAGLSIERIASLAPDVAFVWRDSAKPEEIQRLESLGIRVVVVAARTVDEIPRALETIGEAAGVDVSSRARGFRDGVARLRATYSGRRRLEAFLEIWNKPLTTIAGRHYMNDALEVCGARNVFADLPGLTPVVPWETLYARDPEVVIGAGSAGDRAQFEANWRERPTLSAVKNNRLVYANPDTLQRPSLRIIEGIAQLCEALDRMRR
jgi:iron complex transport system substrate-binding protein